MALDRLPLELIAAVAEHVVLSQPIKDILETAANVKLAQVNRCFRAVVVNTSSLWGTVSNKQSPEMLHLCLQRSGLSTLRVVLLLIEDGTDSYVEFLAAVVPHASRWKEFYFETGRSLSSYLPATRNLPKHCHDLLLPQLHKLTLLYPDPLFYESDPEPSDTDPEPNFEYLPDRPGSFLADAPEARNHFYKSWVTPKLRHLNTRNLIPYHTVGASLVSCKIESQSSCEDYWSAEPLLTMYPHWAGLTSLTLRFSMEYLYTDEAPTMDTIVLPFLANITLSFYSTKGMNHGQCVLDILDFPNVTNMDVSFTGGYLGSAIGQAGGNVRALLRPHTDYAKIEHMKLSLGFHEATIFAATFRREMDTLDARLRFASYKAEDSSNWHPDPLGIESIACTKEMVDVLRRQSGWQGLSELTIVKGAEDKTERVRAVFPGWTIHHQSGQEEVEMEPEYTYADDNYPRSPPKYNWTYTTSDDEDSLFVSESNEGLAE